MSKAASVLSTSSRWIWNHVNGKQSLHFLKLANLSRFDVSHNTYLSIQSLKTILMKISRRSNTSIRSTASKGSSRFVSVLFSSKQDILSSIPNIPSYERDLELTQFYKKIPACLCLLVMKSKFEAVIKESVFQEPIATK